jgi:hypothetical protein
VALESGVLENINDFLNMKGKTMRSGIRLSIALTLSLLLSLITFEPTAHGEPPPRFRADSGVITPTANQILRVTVAGTDGNDTIRVRFGWMKYMAHSCSGMPMVCRHTIASEGTTQIETLGPDDTLSFELQGGAGVRVVVESNSRNARVVCIVFDTSTQRITSSFDTEMLSLN